MSDIKRSRPKHLVEMRVPDVEFIGEKDGSPERLLKNRLAELFQRDTGVAKAYLARVSIGDQVGVALCLSSKVGPDRGLAEKIGVVFRAIFNAHEHLDVMFVSPRQESEVSEVCRPFFRR